MTSGKPYISACPVGCDTALVDTSIVMPEGPLTRCPACGQLVSRIGEQAYWESMRRFNATGFNLPSPREDARRFRVAARRLGVISALLAQPASATRVLDVGCSRGNFLAAGVRLGYRMEGVEPAPDIAAAARAAGLDVHTGLLQDVAFPDASFDAVTLFEVIEHLQEPIALLRECRRVLKPRGILLVSTGNTASWTAAAMRERWDYLQIAKDAGHISFFNPRSIAVIAGRSGFAVERIATSRVKFHEKADVPRWRYALGKFVAEILGLPAQFAQRGHDMLAYLRRC